MRPAQEAESTGQLGIRAPAQPGAHSCAHHGDGELRESQLHEPTSRMEEEDNHDSLDHGERDVDRVEPVESLQPNDDPAEHPRNQRHRDVDAAHHESNARDVREVLGYVEGMVDEQREHHGSRHGEQPEPAEQSDGGRRNSPGILVTMGRVVIGHIPRDRAARAEIEKAKVADQRAQQHPRAVRTVAQAVHYEGRQKEADDDRYGERGPIRDYISKETLPGCHRVLSSLHSSRTLPYLTSGPCGLSDSWISRYASGSSMSHRDGRVHPMWLMM